MSPEPARVRKSALTDGCADERLVVGLGQPVAAHAADELADHLARRREGDVLGDVGRRHHLVGGHAIAVLRQHPHAAAGRDVERLGHPPVRELAGDVHRRVAHADDDHLLATHLDGLERVHVGVAVHQDAVELARVVGEAGAPVVPVGDHEVGVAAGLPRRQGDVPAAVVVARGPLDTGVELDVVAQVEVVDVVAEVLVDQACGAGSRGSRTAPGTPRTGVAGWRCRCAATRRPPSGRWGCGSTSCPRRRHSSRTGRRRRRTP